MAKLGAMLANEGELDGIRIVSKEQYPVFIFY
jgi:hypothetical protein